MNTKTFLATTALEAFWDISQPTLFLGNWCIEDKKLDLKSLDAEILFDPLAKYDFDTTLELIDRTYYLILPLLTDWFNKIHQVNHNVDYWEIIVGPFLFLHIQTVFDRYERIKAAYNKCPDLTTIGLSHSSSFVPLDTQEYLSLTLQSDAWNLQLITELIKTEFIAPNSYKSHDWKIEEKNRLDVANGVSAYKLTSQIKQYLLWCFIKLSGKKTIAIGQYAFSRKKIFRMMLSSKLKIVPAAPRKIRENEKLDLLHTPIDFLLRMQILDLSTNDFFSKIILNTLRINMPMSFIENYKKEYERSQQHYPYFSKAIIGTGFVGEPLRFWGARFKERGMIKIGMQHGGPYGPIKQTSYEFLEHKFCDHYIDWGYATTVKVVAAPEISNCEKIYKKNNIDVTKNNTILWVTSEFHRYPSSELIHSLRSGYLESIYYDWQYKILSHLSPEIFSKLIMRLRHTSFSNRWMKIQEKFTNLNIYKPTNGPSFYEQIWTAKLLLFDNLNTTYLHGFAMNIPSILFFDEQIWPIRSESRPYFDSLYKVGIFHNKPESAYEMINRVANNPFEWWLQKEVQQARKEYCDRFLSISPDWMTRWKNILLKFIGD